MLKSRLGMDAINFGRGFQRMYVVLAAAWFLLVAFMVASDHWLWVPWRVTPTTWTALAKETGVVPYVPPPPSGFETVSTPVTIVVSPLRFSSTSRVAAQPSPKER